MRAQTIGRALGFSVRIAGRMAGQLLAGPAQNGAQAPQAAQTVAARDRLGPVQSHARAQAVTQATAQAGRSVSRGIGGFLRPFRRVGGILWLEVTGVFFLLPVVVFGPNLWRYRASWLHGGDHRMFVASACVVVVFLYLGVSSFWRARQR